MTKILPTPTEAAEAFIEAATDAGFVIEVTDHGGTGGQLLTIATWFLPGDRDAYVAADCAATALIYSVPTVAYGSVWGTTSDGVGGHAGMTGGYYRVSRSGVSKRFAKALAKAVQA